AHTAPPSGKLPSTVRSGKRSRRKEMKTPRATRLKISPISMAPSKEKSDMAGGSGTAKQKPCGSWLLLRLGTRKGREGRRPRAAVPPALLDHLGGGLDQRVGELHALLLRGAGVHEQLHLGADLGLDVAGLLALEDARHHAPGLLAQVAVVDAQGSDGAAL